MNNKKKGGKIKKYCKFCGKKMYRVGPIGNEMTEYDQFTGKKKRLGYSIRLYCEVLKGCGRWYQDQRRQAAMEGLYRHVDSLEGITKKQAESYEEIV